MNWEEILTILIPILGFMGWVYSRIEKKIEAGNLAIKAEVKEIKEELKEIKKEISSVKDRLTRLEGRFDERGYWESREYHKTGTEDKR